MRALLLPLLLASGCVSQAKYDAALARNEHLEDQVESLRARLAKTRAAYEAILADLKPLIDRGVLQVEDRNGRVTIGLASDILFPSGSAELSPSGRDTLAEVARLLARHGREHRFQVEGHTDNEPIATAAFPNNDWLGAARAIHVMDVLVANGFPRDHISAATFGASTPVTSNGTPQGRARNRRIELVLLPDLGELKPPPARAKPRKKRGR